MKKMRKWVSLLCAMVMVFLLAAPAGAAEVEPVVYNPGLEELGITEDIFWDMPAEKRALYQNVCGLTDVTMDQKYFHEVYDTETGDSVLYEVTADEYADRNISILSDGEVTDSISGTWYVLTSSVGRMETSSSSKGDYYVESTLEVDRSQLGIIILDTSAYLGTSINANTSPISGSEYCKIEYTHLTGPNVGKPDSDMIYKAPHKGYGYAFDFLLDNACNHYKITMGFQVSANTTASLTIVDAYGFAGYWGKVLSATPTINIGANGADISVTPAITNTHNIASNTHAQLFVG